MQLIVRRRISEGKIRLRLLIIQFSGVKINPPNEPDRIELTLH